MITYCQVIRASD